MWVAVEGDELVTAHLNPHLRKLENVRRDPRVAVSFEGTRIRPPGLLEYVVVHGRATIEEGGAPELLQELARVYLGPDVRFPAMDDPAARCPAAHRGRAGKRDRPLGQVRGLRRSATLSTAAVAGD